MSLAPQVTVRLNCGSPLMRDRSFYGITVTQFLGAFNDNFYKQLMLLLALPVAPGALDQQQIVTIVFALPFVLFSGIAMQAVNSFGRKQLNCSMFQTSIMTACIGIGIAFGSVLAGKSSRGKTADARVVRWGVCGIFSTLVLMAISLPSTQLGGMQFLLYIVGRPLLALV